MRLASSKARQLRLSSTLFVFLRASAVNRPIDDEPRLLYRHSSFRSSIFSVFSLATFLLFSFADRPASPLLIVSRLAFANTLRISLPHQFRPASLALASAPHRSTSFLRVLACSGLQPLSLQELPPNSLVRSLRPGYLQYHHQNVRAQEVVRSSHTASDFL